jgi:hypothetical protein
MIDDCPEVRWMETMMNLYNVECGGFGAKNFLLQM